VQPLPTSTAEGGDDVAVVTATSSTRERTSLG
jgi:hypothetical protein